MALQERGPFSYSYKSRISNVIVLNSANSRGAAAILSHEQAGNLKAFSSLLWMDRVVYPGFLNPAVTEQNYIIAGEIGVSVIQRSIGYKVCAVV